MISINLIPQRRSTTSTTTQSSVSKKGSGSKWVIRESIVNIYFIGYKYGFDYIKKSYWSGTYALLITVILVKIYSTYFDITSPSLTLLGNNQDIINHLHQYIIKSSFLHAHANNGDCDYVIAKTFKIFFCFIRFMSCVIRCSQHLWWIRFFVVNFLFLKRSR